MADPYLLGSPGFSVEHSPRSARRGYAATKIETDIITTKFAKHALSSVEGSTKEEIEM
jgi:hypothetical protein